MLGFLFIICGLLFQQPGNEYRLLSSTSTGCLVETVTKKDSSFLLVGVPSKGPVTVSGGELLETVWIRNHRIAKILITGIRTKNSTPVKISWNVPGQRPELAENNLFENILERYVVNYETSKYWLDKPGNKTSLKESQPPGICKILVESEGIYRITYSDIIGTIPEIASADPRTIKITNRGFELPILIKGEENGSFDPGDWIEFYGEPPKGNETHLNLYTDKNIYWLSINGPKGARLIDKSVNPGYSNIPTCYRHKIHFETDSIYRVYKEYPDTIAPWFWKEFIGSHNFLLEIPEPIDSGNFEIKIVLRSNGPIGSMRTLINNSLISTEFLPGKQGASSSFVISAPQSILKDSSVLTLVSDSVTIDLDFIEINYLKTYTSKERKIKFSPPDKGRYKFQLKGFKNSSIMVWQPGTAVMTDGQVRYDTTNSTYTFSFEDSYSDSSFYFAQDFVMSPILVRDTAANLGNPSNNADYIIITSPKLIDCANKYASWKSTRGINCKIVTTQDIYDEFNYGIPDNKAIKNFLYYAYRYWLSPPLYVMLLGDASSDHRNIMGFDEDMVPTLNIIDPYYVIIPSDNLYACVNGNDPIPDMLIGRLPVKNEQEFELVLNKLQRRIPFSEWRRKLLFASMNCDQNSIETSNTMVENVVPDEYDVQKIYYPMSSQASLIDEINKGTPFITYIGHSGPKEWSGGLLWNEAIPGLMNIERLPFIAVLGCYNGIFDTPGQDFMGENFILSPGGAILYWGSSGASYNRDKGLVEGPLDLAINNGKNMAGKLTMEGIVRCYASSYTAKVIEQQTLLGDPTTEFSLPKRLELSIIPPSINTKDTCSITGTLEQQITGTAIITLLNNDSLEFEKIKTDINNGIWEVKVCLSDTITYENTRIMMYIWTDSTDFIAEKQFSVDKTNILISTLPQKPTHKDSVYVRAKIFDPEGIKIIKCNWGVNPPPWNSTDMQLDTSGYYVSIQPIPPQPPETEVNLKIFVENNSDSAFSKSYAYKILSLPDISVFRNRVKLDGTRRVTLDIPLVNEGEEPVDSCDVIIYAVDSLDTTRIDKFNLSLEGNETKSINIPWDLKINTIILNIDSANLIEESNEENNYTKVPFALNLFNVSPSMGTNGWVTNSKKTIRCLISPQTITDSSVLEIKTVTINDSIQTDSFKLRNNVTLLKNASVVLSKTQSFAKSASYRWCEEYKKWLFISPDTLFYTKKLGAFKHLEKTDTLSPDITLNVPDVIEFTSSNQQMFLNIKAIISDENAIDIIDKGIVIEHDTMKGSLDTIPENFYTYPTEENSIYSLPVNMEMTLNAGIHMLNFIAYDFHGNKTKKQLKITVKPAFEPNKNYCWGNYPNPVKKDKTEFKFGFTIKPETFTLKIYTLSGKLAKTLTPEILSKDIIIPWDLKAEDGTICGNDVYFYKIYAKADNRIIEKIMKLAILR